MNRNTFVRIKNWMYRNSRPLDFMRWKYHFEDGSKKDVLKVLSSYQNEDGGFGHALEADLWNPNSTPIHTWVATEILHELGILDSHNTIVEGILDYLDSEKDFINNRWLNTVESNNDYPRAHWWAFKENAPSNLDFNPTASLAGFSLLHAKENSSLYLKSKNIIVEAVDRFLDGDYIDDMHIVSCYVRLMMYIEEANKENIIDFKSFKNKLIDQVNYSIERDISKWNNYVCKPSQFFSAPDSVFYNGNQTIIDFEIEHIHKTINADGVWGIPWQWNEYQKEFAISENWWKSNLVILNLLLLKNFNRLCQMNN